MNAPNPEVDAYFGKLETWREEMEALRKIVLGCPLAEELKWRSPCYTFEGNNVVTIWGLKDHCGLAFFKGVLLSDAKEILVAPGENSRSMRKMVFTSVPEIVGMEGTVRDYVLEAIEVEKAGRKVELRKDDLVFPDELVDRFDENPDLRTAFEALTPGRQRGYVLHFSQPKQSRTRVSRIDKCEPRILDGKGLHDR